MIKGFDGVTLWSSDLNQLLPFYRDLMGLPVALESPGFVILGEFENPRLCIGTHSEVHGRPADPYRWLLRFESTDLRADLDRLRAAGVEIIEGPNDQGGGFWLGTVKDPEGNLVQLTYWEPGAARFPDAGEDA